MAEQHGKALVPQIRFAGFTDPWEQRKLGEFDIKTGPFGSTLHAEDYVACGTPIVTTEHFKEGELPSMGSGIPQVGDRDAARLSQFKLQKHDIVFSRVGSVDLNAEVKDAQVGWLFSGRVLRLRTDRGINSTYLHYELGTVRVRSSIIERAVGLTMASINTRILGDTAFFVPATITEQRRIGAFFDRLDSLITLHQRKYDKLCVLKKSMLDKMFPKGGSLYPEIRFAGFTDPWEQRKVGDFLSESRVKGNTGLNSRKLTVKLWGKGVIEKNDFGGSEHTQYFIRHKGQFIYSKLDFLNSAFGVIPEKLDGYESTADLPAFDLVEMNPHFMFFTAIQEGFYLKHGSAADGSRKAKRIHVNTFLEMPIMVPTVAEQDLIVEYLQSLDCLITLHQRKLELLRNIKKSMLDKMFV